MRMVPLSSSIATSAWTVGQCFLASAAVMPSKSKPCSSVLSSCFVFVSSLIAVRISSCPAIPAPYRFQLNASRAFFTAASGTRRVTPFASSKTTVSSPGSPSIPAIRTSLVLSAPSSPSAVTTASRPTNRRQSDAFRSGRSMPGEDTSSAYLVPIVLVSSSLASIARDALAQSPTVTASPSFLSTLTSRTGRLFEPPDRSSKSSRPSGSSSATTISCSASFMFFRDNFTKQKNVGGIPTFSSAAIVARLQLIYGAETIESTAQERVDRYPFRGSRLAFPVYRLPLPVLNGEL